MLKLEHLISIFSKAQGRKSLGPIGFFPFFFFFVVVVVQLSFALSSATAWKGPYICIDLSVRVILIAKFSQVRTEQKNFADQSKARELWERICLPYFYVSQLGCMSWNSATSSQTNYPCWGNDTRPPTVLVLVSMCLHSAIGILNNKQFEQIDGAPQHIKKKKPPPSLPREAQSSQIINFLIGLIWLHIHWILSGFPIIYRQC